jgi:hypothetical protein
MSPRLVPLLVLLASMAPLGTLRLLLPAHRDNDGRDDHDGRRAAGPSTTDRSVGVMVSEEDGATFASCRPPTGVQGTCTCSVPISPKTFPLTEGGGGGSVDDDEDAIERAASKSDSAASDHLLSFTSASPMASMPFVSPSPSWMSAAAPDPSFCWKRRRPWFTTAMRQPQQPYQREVAGDVGLLHRFELEAAEPLHHHAELLLLWMILCVFGVILPAGEWHRGRGSYLSSPMCDAIACYGSMNFGILLR